MFIAPQLLQETSSGDFLVNKQLTFGLFLINSKRFQTVHGTEVHSPFDLL